jgi:serine/alanine adding enzyme
VKLEAAAEVTAQEWDGFVLSHPDGTANHLWGWREIYRRAFGHVTDYLAVRDTTGALAGVLPLVVFNSRLAGRFFVSLPFVNYGGILAVSPDAERALLDETTRRAGAMGASYIELRHRLPKFPNLPAKQHKVSMKAALPPTADRAWEALDRKVRNQVRKAEKAGVTVERGGMALVDDFYAVFARNMRDLGTPVYPRAWFTGLLGTFPDRARVFVARLGALPVAASMTFVHPGSVEIPSASSLREHRSTCANMLLYWHMMQQAIADGFSELDFGRSTPDESTFHFKEQWGARPGPMSWEYQMLSGRALPDRSPSNRKYQLAIAAWRRLPLPVANELGPRIVRFLP